jgi:hypothetical protein
MKAKIIISAMFLFLFSYSSFAQNKKGFKWGLSVAMNSIQAQVAIPLVANSGEMIIDGDGNIVLKGDRTDHSISYSVLPKYYINDDVLLRFEFGITNLNLKADFEVEDVATSYHETDEDEVTTKIYRYAPGFQWFFFKEKKIESYCGMTASYIYYQSSNYHYYHERRNLTTGALLASNDVTKITPGGFATGAGAFAGFNIYLLKRISLGAELSSSALYYKLGGEVMQTYKDFNIGGPNPTVTYYSTYPNAYKGFKISKITSSFNISFWL